MDTKLVPLLLISLAIAVAGDYSSELPPPDFVKQFEALSERRHPDLKNKEAWLESRTYIEDEMYRYGARIHFQQLFNTTVNGRTVEGANIIGIANGTHHTSDQIIVVGADYDTKTHGNHFKDNTGGVACLLEIMHLFFDRIYYNPHCLNYTVIFVAFDLNTREYEGSDNGHSGSYHFLHKWLLPFLEESKDREFLGAIILDSVTTFNAVNESQNLRTGFDKAMPEAYNEITRRGRKGDFLGLLYTSQVENNPIKNSFVDFYNKDRKLRPFRLQEMEIHLNLSVVESSVMDLINHQSHYAFWIKHMPAFLLFDTDGDRVDPYAEECLESCEVGEFLNKPRVSFMVRTVEAVVSTLVQLQTTYDHNPPAPGAGVRNGAEIIFTLFATFTLALLMQRN